MIKSRYFMYLPTVIVVVAALTVVAPAFAKNNSKPATEWYMKTLLSVSDPTGLEINDRRSGVFGKIAGGEQGHDRYDVPAFNSTVNSKAAIVFVHGDDWDDKAGEYLSSYHGTNSQTDSWVFTVNSTVTGAVLTLSWDGLYELTQVGTDVISEYAAEKTHSSRSLHDLKLIDLETLEVTEAFSNGEMNSYTFSLDGETSRQFRWVLGPILGKYFKQDKDAKHYIKTAQKQQAAERHQAAKGRSKKQQAMIDRFGHPPEK